MANEAQEHWRDIPGYEGLYQASNFGRVKSLARNIKNTWGTLSKHKERILRLGKKKGRLTSYWMCSLRKNGVSKSCNVHRLVAILFIPNPLGKKYVNHRNGNGLDNTVGNLEWVTMGENNQHAWDTGSKRTTKNMQDACRVNQKIAAKRKMKCVCMLDSKYKLLKIFQNHSGMNTITGKERTRFPKNGSRELHYKQYIFMRISDYITL